MRSLQILTATAALAAAIPAQWALLNPTTVPAQRRSGAAAFDATSNRLIFYGGVSPTPSVILPQTWSFNGSWTQLTPAGGSLGRWGHQLVRNTQNNRLITFGGRSPTITGFANDTYEWTGSAWTSVPTPTSPSARYLYGLSFDQSRNVAVLFGGRTSTTTLADTWEYNGITWTQRTPATSPPAREEMAMVYDASLGATVLFGGYDSDTATVLGDTWHYNGQDWVAQAPANSPSPRYRGACIYDSVRQRIVLFGGYTGSTITTDTFEYTGSTWNVVATSGTVPQASTETLHGYDPQRRKFVLFGGFGGSFSNQTWEYTGATTGFFSTFGTACPTPNGEATISSNTPRIAQPWTLTFDNLPVDLELVLVVLGLSNQVWSGLPLPFDLAPIGLTGCDLLVSADLINVVVAVGGTATHTLAIPNQVNLVNQRLYAQGILLDLLPVDYTFLGTTKGGRAILGN